jgi:hypothetical protein
LPDDEQRALEIVEMLLSCGADPNASDESGNTAADWARKRGMLMLVEKLTKGTTGSSQAKHSVMFESLAKDLLVAYESGYQPALDRLNQHYRTSMTWEELRNTVQQRLRMIPRSELPMSEMYEGYFALPHAQLLVAKQEGSSDWTSLLSAKAEF